MRVGRALRAQASDECPRGGECDWRRQQRRVQTCGERALNHDGQLERPRCAARAERAAKATALGAKPHASSRRSVSAQARVPLHNIERRAKRGPACRAGGDYLAFLAVAFLPAAAFAGLALPLLVKTRLPSTPAARAAAKKGGCTCLAAARTYHRP